MKFSLVCDLLQRLDTYRKTAAGRKNGPRTIQEWFDGHRTQLARDWSNASALLSTLLPELRTDRVFELGEARLVVWFARAVALGSRRTEELRRMGAAGSSLDLGDCIEKILLQAPNAPPSASREVTVEEIDCVLHRWASGSRWSSPSVRSSFSSPRSDAREEIETIYRRLTPRDAKWFTRLVLKSFEPVILDAVVVYRSYHPSLPTIIAVRNDFVAAGRILQQLMNGVQGEEGARPAAKQNLGHANTGSALAQFLKPQLGTKVGRQTWLKGRSITHCLKMGHGRMSCEEKIDGEYCQIHIDLSKGENCIQIFSKSGKDSTQDRRALHKSIRESLKLKQPSCPFKKGCILEGELVVYSDREHRILDFHKIRKHVSRSGSFLGTEQDSLAHAWEQLMVVYYDVLMVDDESLLPVRHSKRFERLRQLVACIPGCSALVASRVIDFSSTAAEQDLRKAFAQCIQARREGLVLKPDDPYLELKKAYFGSFGDLGDLAVVGARYDAALAKSLDIANLRWTHFYIACLENKDEVHRWGQQPRFIVTNVVSLNQAQLRQFMRNHHSDATSQVDNAPFAVSIAPGFDGGKNPCFYFANPPVFDVRCFAFDKACNTGFWSPRFPTVSKVHYDRTFRDILSFAELQKMAEEETRAEIPQDSQEVREWVAALEDAEPNNWRRTGELQISSQSTQLTTATTTTTNEPMSPAKSVCPGSQPQGQQPPQPSKSQTTRHQADHAPALIGVGQLTPPRSSALQPTVGGSGDRKKQPAPSSQENSGLGKKRASEASSENISPRRTKTRRRAASGPREPLADVSPSSPFRNSSSSSVTPGAAPDPPRLPVASSMYEPSLEREHAEASQTTRMVLPTSVSFQAAGSSSRSLAAPPSQAEPSQQRDAERQGRKSSQASASSAAGQCRFCPESCPLARYSFLLSPCVSGIPWLTEDLFSDHGVRRFAVDPAAWDNEPDIGADGIISRGQAADVVNASNTAAAPLHTRAVSHHDPGARFLEDEAQPLSWPHAEQRVPPVTTPAPRRATATGPPAKRTREKIALVDARRKLPTAAFIRRIEAARLTRAEDGRPEHVRVYDWRVLEELTAEEERMAGRDGDTKKAAGARLSVRSAGSVWKKHLVGVALSTGGGGGVQGEKGDGVILGGGES